MPNASQSIADFKGDHLSIKMVGGAPDVRVLLDVSISAAGTTLTSLSNPFAAGDVGKVICVLGAGAAGADLATTIASFTNAGSVELTDAAGTTVSAAIAVFGSDNKNALAALRSTCTATGRKYKIPSGAYLTTETTNFIGASVEIEGDATDNEASSMIVYVGTGTAVYVGPEDLDNQCFAANLKNLQVACYGGATDAIKLRNLSQAHWERVGINESDGAHCANGLNLVNPNIEELPRAIVTHCDNAVVIDSTGFPFDATKIELSGGNYYENGVVFDIRANAVSATISRNHIERFNTFVKLDKHANPNLLAERLVIEHNEIVADGNGFTGEYLIQAKAEGIETLRIRGMEFRHNRVYYITPRANPISFDVAATGTADIDFIIEHNTFSNIDTSLITTVSSPSGIRITANDNLLSFGSPFALMAAGHSADLTVYVGGGETIGTANRVPYVSAPGKISADAGFTYYGTAGSKTLEVASDNATDGQIRVGVADASRVMAISVPTAAYTVLLKFLGAVTALAIKGLLTVGSDEQPTVTLYVHNNDTGGHTQFQVKGNAADGSGQAIVNILTAASVAAMQVLGDGQFLLPLLATAKFLGVSAGGVVEAKSSVSLTSDVSGTLPVGNGGTGATSLSSFGTTLAGDSTFLAAMVLAFGTYYYTQFDVDNILSNGYYTKSTIDGLLANLQSQIDGKAGTGHTHTDSGHTHGGGSIGPGSTDSGSANIT